MWLRITLALTLDVQIPGDRIHRQGIQLLRGAKTQFLFPWAHTSNCHTIVAITRSEGDQSHSRTKEETEAESRIC